MSVVIANPKGEAIQRNQLNSLDCFGRSSLAGDSGKYFFRGSITFSCHSGLEPESKTLYFKYFWIPAFEAVSEVPLMVSLSNHEHVNG